MRKLVGTISVTAIAAAALMVAPSLATGATTIGQTFTPDATCVSNFTRVQSVAPSGQYAAPADGVITRWSFQAGATPPTGLKFKVGRAAPGADFTTNATFTIIGESFSVNPVASTLNSYPIQIPVQAGDRIGQFQTSGGNCRRTDPIYTHHSTSGDQPPGSSLSYGPFSASQLDISAILEPDCDKDGFGDETQDQNLSTCAAPGPGSTSVFCKGKPATIVGTAGSDVRTGSRGRDVIVGLGGSDRLSGLAGNDLICGGKGKDNLSGGKGKDKLYGQKGKDKLRGKAGKDLCVGGPGKDKAKGCEKTKSI